MTEMITLDWLQCFCLGNLVLDNAQSKKMGKFIIRDVDKETIQFKRLFYVYLGKHKVAEIQQIPRTKVINPKATLVKLENRLLYTSQYCEILYDIFKCFDLVYKGITRIDVALDCQELWEGKDVQDFLQKCLVPRQSDEGFIYNVGRTHVVAHMCRDNKGNNRINSVKWGSPKSRISCYCYDKTLELIEKKDKPWIRNAWDRNGIEWEYNEEELSQLSRKQKERMIKRTGLQAYVKKPVWRFEISIKGQGKQVVIEDTGEILSLDIDYLKNSIQVKNLFYSYARHCFKFRQNTGQVDKYNFKPLQIFNPMAETPYLPKQLNEGKQTGRTEKIVANKLREIAESLGEDDDVIRYAYRQVIDHVQREAQLNMWFYNKAIAQNQMLENARKRNALARYVDMVVTDGMVGLLDKDTSERINHFESILNNKTKEIEDEFEDDIQYWLSLSDFMSNMQSPNTVIPEGAERPSQGDYPKQ